VEDSNLQVSSYAPRVIDAELDELLAGLSALSLDGARGVGKTSTARHRGGTVIRLDHPASLAVIHAQPDLLTMGSLPIVIDEWQRYPPSWDVVRRAVDDDARPGRFILTGSATPTTRPTHSGAGRIVTRRMRPLTLPERGIGAPTVSLATLLSNGGGPLEGTTEVTLQDYTSEILTGGFPGMRHGNARTQRAALDGYLERIIDADLPELGVEVRSPAALRRWATAYAAATSTTTSYEKIRTAAGGGHAPAKTTTISYHDALERLWLLDPVPAWFPTNNHLRRLTAGPKHQLADPALAARLVGLDAGALLRGEGPASMPRDGAFLGALFESLVALTLRVFAQAAEAKVSHLRTRGGEQEVDYIVSRGDQRVLGVEVKLSQTVDDHDVRHLSWLRQRLGHDLVDAIVVTTGPYAYRRPDGIGVVPLALLGP
jgi:predicted AAA+ superfamily ATPase